ncbi:hypothetical protein BAUCODRAFT_526662 [Baudoinia panamericana UAMH 10762]|uniref:Uncharacterized protein n=1 Tax=Baudoinia panamericana (strain UAMH 10762) TaxID=717646 RepID=M2N7R2_BAUPA|nr:uncharacterized protein BAUCODRAFT_526662 [Baudoinia panamericana UAMH 10762]EMC95109.1 hypothetical protein BAUCODRAFT_526662 [Baudoinia panamericana UAMH 10762]
MKTVCIVGAGPAGLVAAKTFLDYGSFAVTVFDKADRVGGIWALDEDTQNGYLSPQTPTNLSRFTVGFSDLDWNDVDLRSNSWLGSTRGPSERPFVPLFPKAWQVNRYLEEYRRRYVPDSVLKLGHEVVKATRDEVNLQASSPSWHITSRNGSGQLQTMTYDYLIVASGFFSTPSIPQTRPPDTTDGDRMSTIVSMHSSEFRSLDDLFPDSRLAAGKTILLVGGGNSSGETAAAVAMQLSDALWSPDKSRRKLYEGCKIIHVTPRPLYAVPPYVEYDTGSRTYVPLDFKLYDFSKRPQELESYGGVQPPAVRAMVHGAVQAMVGGDQAELGSEALLIPPADEKERAVYVALAESYSEFARSGLIEGCRGRVIDIQPNQDGTASALTSTCEERVYVIGAVIYATGYTPATALDFLADDIKRALQYEPTSMRLPIILDQWQTVNSSFPDLAFLGFYVGPYWPMVEMQAKLTADRWMKGTPLAPQKAHEHVESLLGVRTAEREQSRAVPQYWFNDYLGYLEDIAKHLDMLKNDGRFQNREGCPSPARYVSAGTNRKQANAIIDDMYRTWHDCVGNGRYVARAAFRALQGTWDLSRRITSAQNIFSGTFTGTAAFHPRFPTPDKSRKSFDLEYLYIESGTFTPANDHEMTLPATRRYVYRYSEERDELSVWFLKPSSDLEVDYLFHNLTFVSPKKARTAGACIAKADHLCIEDMYWTEYILPLEAIVLRTFEVKHTVKGPQKDYVATATYKRPGKTRCGQT